MPSSTKHVSREDPDSLAVSRAHYDALCQRLEEAEATLQAIRNGEVDALVVHGLHGDQIYTLRSADEPYRILIEQMQEAALTLSGDGAILYCNQFFARLVRREHSDVIGRYLNEFMAASERAVFSTLLRQALVQPVNLRTLLQDAEGRVFPARLALNALRSREFEGLCAVVTDLTQQEEKDRAITAERLTAAVLEATSDAVLVCNDAGTVMRTNGKAANLFGPDCLGRPIDSLCQLPQPFTALVQTPDILANLELRHTDAGSPIYLLAGIRRLSDSELDISGWVITLADITRQKDMGRAVRASEASFRQLAGAVPDMVWSTDADGNVDYVNKQWSAYSGTAPRRAFWVKIVHPEDRSAVRLAWSRARSGGRPVELQLRLRSTAGEYRWHQVRGVPVKNDAGEAIRWLGTCSDIEDLMQAKAELERRAQQLKEADQRKDEFLAVLGHELRNPLAGITNGVALLKRGLRTPEQLTWTHNMIGEQVMQLTRLLNDLLDVARITQGKIQLQQQLLDIRPLIEAAVASARRLIDSRGHNLSVTFPGHPVWVRGDNVRLEQIIVNLLTNAAKYTERNGDIALAVEARAGNVYLRVRDNGIGIAAEMLEHIFEPFRQLRAPGRAASDGLGIGLTLARRLVQLHGGDIAVTSGPGAGSEFVVQLPQAQLRTSQPVAPPELDLPAFPPGTRILIVDDNVDTVDGLAMLLGELGCHVHTVYDGMRALAVARERRPHIVLLDIGLPDMDGCEVASRMRAGDAPADALLIAITGYGGPEARHRALQAGFDHYLVKPVDYRELVKLCIAMRTACAG